MFAGALLSALLCGGLVSADQPFELPTKAMQRDLAPGQSHAYRALLEKGQYLQVSVRNLSRTSRSDRAPR